MGATPSRGSSQGPRNSRASVTRLEHLVHDAEFHGSCHSAGDALVFFGQRGVQSLTLTWRCSRETLAVQDADGSGCTHDGYFSAWPCEDSVGAE